MINIPFNQMPMRKIFTPVHSTQVSHPQDDISKEKLNPSEATINKILQFASGCRVEKVSNEDYVKFFLN